MTAIGLDDVKTAEEGHRHHRQRCRPGRVHRGPAFVPLEGDELPDKPLVAVVPVSVRSDLGDSHGSNQVSTMFVQLPVEVDDPIARLDAIHEGTQGAKEEHEALGEDTLITWAEHATPNFFANASRLYSRMRLADHHRPIANLVISNVPGPDFPLYLGGAVLEAVFPLGPVMDGMGVNITIMSYRGVLYWGIMASPDNIPKLWNLTAGIPLALDELLAAAGEPRPPSGPRMPRRPYGPRGSRSDGTPVAQGEGATAMDEAPEHTGMARPKVSEAGSIGEDGVEPLDDEGTGAARAEHDVGRVAGTRTGSAGTGRG